MIAEALAQIGGEAVIDRAAIGVVGVHISEGNAAAECGRVAIGVEPRYRADHGSGLSYTSRIG